VEEVCALPVVQPGDLSLPVGGIQLSGYATTALWSLACDLSNITTFDLVNITTFDLVNITTFDMVNISIFDMVNTSSLVT